MLRDLGYTYRESGNLDKVIPILEEANNMAKSHVEQEWARERCHVLNILAFTLREMFRLDLAKEYIEMSVDLTKDAFGSQHREVIERLCNYGIILHDRWENEEAIQVLGEARKLIDANYREEKFIRAQVINYTAKIHLRWLLGLEFLEGKAEEVKKHLDISKALHEEALEIYSKLYGEHKGRFNAGTMMTYAAVLQRCGALDDALQLCQKAVDIYRAAGHIAWPRAATWLADIHLARGEYRMAVDILEGVMKEHRKRKLNISPGAYHPKALLAEARALLGDKKAGKSLLEECVAEWRVKKLDEEHYWFVRAQSFLQSLMSLETVSKEEALSS